MPNFVAGKYAFSISKSIKNNCLRIFSAELAPNVLGPLGLDTTLGVVNPVVPGWRPRTRYGGSQGAVASGPKVADLGYHGTVREVVILPVVSDLEWRRRVVGCDGLFIESLLLVSSPLVQRLLQNLTRLECQNSSC